MLRALGETLSTVPMFIPSKNIALLAALACAPFVSAQDTQNSAGNTPAPSAPEKRPRRGGFLAGLSGDKQTARPETIRLTVEQAVSKALAANRELKAAAYLVTSAQARRSGAGLLDNPEAEFGAGPGLHAKGTFYMQAEIRQKFPLSSRLRLAEDIADIHISAAREEVLIARRRLIGEIKKDSVRLLALRAESALLEQRAKIARELATSARDRVARGEEAETEAGFLEVETASFSDEIARLDAERGALLAEWRVELGLKPDADADIEGDIPADRDNFGLPDPTACPECRKLTLLTEALQKSVELEIAKRTGDITAGVFGQLQHDGERNRHLNQSFVGLKVIVPIPLWNDNRGGIAEAKSSRDRQLAELAAEVQRLDGDAMSARREYDKLSARLPDLVEKLAPAAAAQTARVRAALTRGEGASANLYRALDKQTEIERRTLTLRRDIALALVRLETALSAHPSLKDPVVTPELPE
jgi:cobalt-zinc-cadmium efflux system outer membrane protein